MRHVAACDVSLATTRPFELPSVVPTSHLTKACETTCGQCCMNLVKSHLSLRHRNLPRPTPYQTSLAFPCVCYPVPGLAAHVFKGREPWSFRTGKKDADTTLRADDPACKPIEYPKPDGVLSFDLLNNLALSGVKHEHDQPAHLRIKEGMEDVASEVKNFHVVRLACDKVPNHVARQVGGSRFRHPGVRASRFRHPQRASPFCGGARYQLATMNQVSLSCKFARRASSDTAMDFNWSFLLRSMSSFPRPSKRQRML